MAALVGDPGRARMLVALLGRRALTATELADVAGVTAATASGHLAKMTDHGLLSRLAQGRHRYYRLASVDVARMLEGMVVVADAPKVPSPRVPAAMRESRTCYDHLAGRWAVALADALVTWDEDVGIVTPDGEKLLAEMGVKRPPDKGTKRVYCRLCVDWSERRPHIAGALGAALLDRLFELKWITRGEGRVVHITERGRSNLGGFQLSA